MWSGRWVDTCARPFVLVQSLICVSTLSAHRYDGRRDFGQHRVGHPYRRPAAGGRPAARAGARRRAGGQPRHRRPRLPGAAPAWPARHRRSARHPGTPPPTGGRPPLRAAPRHRCPAPATCPGVNPTPGCCPRWARTWRRSPPTNGPPVGYSDAGVLPELAEAARARLRADGVPAGELDRSPAARWTASSGCSAPTCAPATRWPSRTRAGPTCSTWSPRWACARSAYRWTTRGRLVAGVAAALAAGARALVVTSRAQNPTGAAVSAGPRRGAAGAARRPPGPAADRGRPRGRTGPRTPAPAGRGDASGPSSAR